MGHEAVTGVLQFPKFLTGNKARSKSSRLSFGNWLAERLIDGDMVEPM